ncbi:phage/plasmid replication domain-containing protein [Methylomonas fluvii]|uniref:Replication-associated protein G2P n=1 Tax=Methylomonas fluvii TaxID=1854564 RepID=A0ABR9DHX3_9GAMM|nr:phage/plasmid replication protein [Methylomonas fluvii]MBD9362712.1 Replication-associated protein G2P [Methylomonas fluvii]CAD6875855.1 hypothetical protein [Methylomonas fluvii]
MFFDWLSCYQDFDFDLPIIANDGYIYIDFVTGDTKQARQNRINHEGSFSTSIQVQVKGRRIYVSGNPSRFNRLDNVFGFSTIEQCVAVYNGILEGFGLPLFTPCTFQGFRETVTCDGKQRLVPWANGLVITELHCTTNISVGKGCTDAYLKAIAMLPYRNSVPRLHTNGKTTDWLSKQGNARDLYAKVYEKANELSLKTLPLFKKRYGERSDEFQYMQSLVNYCEEVGMVRFEQKFRGSFLRKNNLHFWGLSDFETLQRLHEDFLNIDEKLKVSAMNLQTLTETLLSEGICKSTQSANSTALYAINWMNGQKYSADNRQAQMHRARLRKIGIDILKPCNLTVFSPVIVKEVIEIEKRSVTPPSFYRHPNHLRLAA